MDVIRYMVKQLNLNAPMTGVLAQRGGGSGFYFAVGDHTQDVQII